MKNLVLLIVLALGLVGGYFAGQYRGREARKALEQAVETGKALDRERASTIASLKKDLDGIGEKYKQDIETSRKNYEAKAAEWQRTKLRLDETIDHQTKSLTALNKTLAAMEKIGASAGTDKDLAQLRKAAAGLQRELDGNACLKTPLPSSVLDALGSTGMTEAGR